jgi:4-hydroxy-2-oxoglutarate aldolase
MLIINTRKDLPTFEAHVTRIAKAGCVPLVAGSMGEAIHLTHSERTSLITAARRSLDRNDLSHVPIIAGTGAGSTRETIELCYGAAEAGADFAIVICSGYFAGVFAENKQAIKAFYTEVADKSPIPVMIYNCVSSLPASVKLIILLQDPSASGGINLDSAIIVELALECPNICGVKLTYGAFC